MYVVEVVTSVGVLYDVRIRKEEIGGQNPQETDNLYIYEYILDESWS